MKNKISMQVISLVRPNLDLLIIRSSNSNVIELVWRKHEEVTHDITID